MRLLGLNGKFVLYKIRSVQAGIRALPDLSYWFVAFPSSWNTPQEQQSGVGAALHFCDVGCSNTRKRRRPTTVTSKCMRLCEVQAACPEPQENGANIPCDNQLTEGRRLPTREVCGPHAQGAGPGRCHLQGLKFVGRVAVSPPEPLFWGWRSRSPTGRSPPCVLLLAPCPIFPCPLPFPFPWEPPDFPCFTALCPVHTEEGNSPRRWLGASKRSSQTGGGEGRGGKGRRLPICGS